MALEVDLFLFAARLICLAAAEQRLDQPLERDGARRGADVRELPGLPAQDVVARVRLWPQLVFGLARDVTLDRVALPQRNVAVDLNLLVVLEALLAERSVTRSAQRIGLSQPAVSNALGRLRALLDDPLR